MVMVIDNGLKRRENHSLKLRRRNDNVDVEIEEEELHTGDWEEMIVLELTTC